MRGGGAFMFSCAREYNLQKASDSLEYSVLLERLIEVDFNGKLWKLLKNWYEEVSCYVKIDVNFLRNLVWREW